jgi:hypothetical protein
MNRHLGNVNWYKIKFNYQNIEDHIESSELVENSLNTTIYKLKVKTIGGVLECFKILHCNNIIYCASSENAVSIRILCVKNSTPYHKYIFTITWEDDQGGMQVLDTHKITSIKEFKRLNSFIMEQANYFIASKPFDLTEHLFWNISDEWLSANNNWDDDSKLQTILKSLGLVEIDIDDDSTDYMIYLN